MTDPVRPRRWPWVGVALFLSFAVVGLALAVENGTGVVDDLPFVLAFGMFGVAGALIISRTPGNRVGALLLYGSCMTALSFVAGELGTYLVGEGVTEGPVVYAAMLFSSLGWLFGILPVVFLLPLLFPDGHLPSRRWIVVPVAMVAFMVFGAVAFVLGEPELSGSVETLTIDNPLYVDAIGSLSIPDSVFGLSLIVILVASVASVVVRFRRSRGAERQQIKWVAFAFVFFVVSLAASEVSLWLGLDNPWVEILPVAIGYLAIPVSIVIAILQFHLFDLDVVVKKALVAGAFALLVIAVYAAVVGLSGVIVSEGENAGAVFVTALLLGLAFRPVAGFARRIADRIVYGRRATPYEVLTRFSERVGEAYATEDVLGRMAQILGEGTGATASRVWLRVGNEFRPAASWPSDAPDAEPITVVGDALPELGGEFAMEVRDGGEALGALSIAVPANDPMNPSKERLVHDLAAHAGLVLRNVRLVEELRASQRRIVRAQDQERRRIERNIHDGSQQQLVALSVKARLAHGLARTDPGKADQMLEQIEGELQSALEDLRDLARGIYPPLLADQGLCAALEAQARRSPVPATVRADHVGRYPQEVEAAVYFSCLEALQNAAKHADAGAVSIRLEQSNGRLRFEVADDGRGFRPGATGYGTGLQGISDRLAALHGRLEVSSEPGAGTTVRGTVEVGA